MKNIIKEYLTQRFLKNNRTKYYKYFNEGINNITKEQIDYFIEEKNRLSL